MTAIVIMSNRHDLDDRGYGMVHGSWTVERTPHIMGTSAKQVGGGGWGAVLSGRLGVAKADGTRMMIIIII
jgi:hypothetical protein